MVRPQEAANGAMDGTIQEVISSLPEHIHPRSGLPVPLDMTDIIYYDSIVEEVSRVNTLTGPYYIGEFLKAMNIANSYHSKAICEYEKSLTESKKMFALAMLDKAPDALKLKGLRSNEEFCKQFAHTDKDYLDAKERESYWKAVSKFLEGKYERFRCAHDDAKKIFDNLREPYGQASSLPSGKDTA